MADEEDLLYHEARFDCRSGAKSSDDLSNDSSENDSDEEGRLMSALYHSFSEGARFVICRLFTRRSAAAQLISTNKIEQRCSQGSWRCLRDQQAGD
jgi:hypothetical protein